MSHGPLAGLRVLEFEAIGPGPFAGMMLADMGADVLLVDRPAGADLGFGRERRFDVMLRGRRSIMLDLKSAPGVAAALMLCEKADALIEGFRPGVMERLGLGPEVVHARNPRLVYGRMTGWGQSGPLADRAGHDIDYIAVAGVLNAIGRAGEPPLPPLNLVGDFGGGGMLLAFGIACGVIEARTSGRGQVVDAAMIDGAAILATMVSGLMAAGHWRDARGVNVLDSGAPWYDSYETRDGLHIAVGAIEARFYAELLERLGLDRSLRSTQHDRSTWPALRATLTARFRTRTRAEWVALFAGSDACVAPVLTFAESRAHPQVTARAGAIELGGIVQPAPAPRFTRTPGAATRPPPERGSGGTEALRDWGFDASAIVALQATGAR
ncbi:MAG TPA: CaiB/BaiF CoA-transferase family protein [Caldimonas sp.]|nr:CaiB/BaiF CoA-transferase family protein [Caldimonas sp.]HEX4234633.1 CaiB/BaiF CoA-transferase family protein [Caldimonas sp.]